MAGPRALALSLLVILLCLCLECSAARKKKPCKYNKKKYKAGAVIEALEDNCAELKCSKKGKKLELNIIEGCTCGKEECSSLSPPGFWIPAGIEDPPTCSDYNAIPTGISIPGGQCCQPKDGPAPTDGPKPTDGGSGTGSSDCNCDYGDKYSDAHTMNKYDGPDASCGEYHKTGVTDDEIKTILKTHNDLREKVAKGEETQGSPGPQPGATNMFELKWNCELAEVAQRWAEQCKLGHDKSDDRKICNQDYYVGQNAFMEWHYLADSAWEKAINKWYDEVKDMPKSVVDEFKSVGAVIGHYTQVVWAETYEVGCGGIHFPATLGSDTYQQSKVYVCNYGAGGNWLGSKIYESGSAATNCPNGVSAEYPGLCAPPS